MRIRLQTYPPLGDVTIVGHNTIPFHVVLDVPYRWKDEPWEVTLWHSTSDHEWRGLCMSRLDGINSPISVHNSDIGTARFYFGADLTFHSTTKFTIKFRHGSPGSWVWANEALGHDDGQVINLNLEQKSNDIHDVIPDLESSWKSTPLLSQAPQTRLWSLKHDIAAARDDKPSSLTVTIGTPWGSFVRHALSPCIQTTHCLIY